MDAYRLYTVVPRLLGFIEALTNWYVRLNRPRLKGVISEEDWRVALETLADVLITLSRLMAPFAPFFSEYTYQNLKGFAPEDVQSDSVHFLMIPPLRDDIVDTSFEAAVAKMQEAICLGRVARERRNVSVKQPLRRATIVHRNRQVLDAIKSLEVYVKSELNVRELQYSTKEEDFVVLKADADGQVLGKRLKKAFASVHKAVRALSSEDVLKLERDGSIQIQGYTIDVSEIKISRQLAPSLMDNADHLEAVSPRPNQINNQITLKYLNEVERPDLCSSPVVFLVGWVLRGFFFLCRGWDWVFIGGYKGFIGRRIWIVIDVGSYGGCGVGRGWLVS